MNKRISNTCRITKVLNLQLRNKKSNHCNICLISNNSISIKKDQLMNQNMVKIKMNNRKTVNAIIKKSTKVQIKIKESLN